jgi:hypothetical protein
VPSYRPCLREQVAASINAWDLSPSALRETNVDRLGALAFSDPLGGALWALKWGNDARAYPRVFVLLVHASRRICGDLSMRGRLSAVAIEEWLDDKCRNCGGRGIIGNRYAGDLARPCLVCDGTGGLQASELWRANRLGIERSTYRKWERRYNEVQGLIVDAEARAVEEVRRQLERR